MYEGRRRPQGKWIRYEEKNFLSRNCFSTIMLETSLFYRSKYNQCFRDANEIPIWTATSSKLKNTSNSKIISMLPYYKFFLILLRVSKKLCILPYFILTLQYIITPLYHVCLLTNCIKISKLLFFSILYNKGNLATIRTFWITEDARAHLHLIVILGCVPTNNGTSATTTVNSDTAIVMNGPRWIKSKNR